MLEDLQYLAARYAEIQRGIMRRADHSASLKEHVSATLRRCLPPSVATDELAERCFRAVRELPVGDDPMHTGAIHAWAGLYLQTAMDAEHPLLRRLHRSALKLLPAGQPATRDELRLVALDALYEPQLLPPGEYTAYVRHRLGLNRPRLSCEEIALTMRKPLVYIHELESAILTMLSAKGDRHA